jgi:nicotinamide riboside transporter PnuC
MQLNWPLQLVLEWAGALTSITALLLLALNLPGSRWAWPIGLVSNIAWAGFSVITGAWGLLLQQGAFFILNVVGCFRWFKRKTPPY